jgi:hypothetical protein
MMMVIEALLQISMDESTIPYLSANISSALEEG